MLGQAALSGLAGAAWLTAPAEAAPSATPHSATPHSATPHSAAPPPGASLSVLDFGARGDSKTDNTLAFQKALDAAHARGGAVVSVPAGRYLFKGHLTIPTNTTLEGVGRAPSPVPDAGTTVLMPTEGRNQPDGTAFITMVGSVPTLKGLMILYPEQDPHAAEPTPYPWTIVQQGGQNLTVRDVTLLNPYQGINLTLAGRHFLSGIYGQPLALGIYVDQCYDVGRIENVHFWPFWNVDLNAPIVKWVNAHGVGLRFGRTDWQYVLNTFCFGYNIGYHFVQTKDGTCNGNFVGIGSDSSGDAVVVENVEPFCGVQITNGEFVGMVRPDSQGLVVRDTNMGPVTLQNCAFWGPSDHIGTLRGSGPVTLTACNFSDWDRNNKGEPAFVVEGGGTTISQSQFLKCGTQNPALKTAARIGAGCASAVMLGNTLQGDAFRVVGPARPDPSRYQIAMNVIQTVAAK